MIKTHIKIILFFSCFSIIKIHPAAFLRSANPTRPYTARTRRERQHQGNILMHEALKELQNKSQTRIINPLPQASELLEILSAKKPQNKFIDDFVTETKISAQLANQPFNKRQILTIIDKALQQYHPQFNQYNKITMAQFHKLEEFKSAMVAKIVKARSTQKK